jgi:hypothetical protein
MSRSYTYPSKPRNNVSIRFNWSTYNGTADDYYGVFTRPKTGAVFAGSHANGSGRVGVATATDGSTSFVECDADGKFDGRYLDCYADGDTEYGLCEHGNLKEQAVMFADGTCEYNTKVCSADFPPFVKLKAKVLPIKARPTPLCDTSAAASCIRPHPLRPHRPPIGPSAMCWHSQELATTHADKVRARLRRPPSMAARRNPQRLQKECTAHQTWTTHRP